MSPTHTPPPAEAAILRQRAEQLASERATGAEKDLQSLSAAELRELVRELQIRQIELELQQQDRQQSQDRIISTLLDSAADFIFYKDTHGVYLGCNSATAAVIGLPKEDVVGKSDLELFDPETANRLRQRDHHLLESGQPHHDEEWLTHSDGRRALVDTLKTAVCGSDGKVIGILGVGRDITKYKQIEEETKRQAALINCLLDSIPDLIFYKDTDSVCLGCNPSFADFLCRPREEIIGKTDRELFGEVVAVEFEKWDQRVITNREVTRIEEWVPLPDGSRRLYDTAKSPFYGPDGRLMGVLGISRDITHFKQVEMELADGRERLNGIIAGTNVGTWEWNVQTGAIVINERWAEMLGYAKEEFGPTTIALWERLAHPDDLEVSKTALQKTFNRETEQYEVEVRMRHKDGSWIWVLDSGRVFRWSPEGEPLMMMGTHQDITPRKQTEAELARVSVIQRELMRLATTFVNVPMERQNEAIQQSLATMGQLIHADRAYLFTYDFDAGLVSNTHEWCADGVAPEIDNLQNFPIEWMPDWLDAHRSGQPVIVTEVAPMPMDDPRHPILKTQGIHSLVTLPLLQDGRCAGFVGFDAVREPRNWQDEEIALLRVLAELYAHFGERVAAERATRDLQESLMAARDEARAAAQAKSLFLANMSHEIRTPLNAILGYAQIMEDDGHNSANSERLRAIMRSGDHLLTLINDLLELVRSDARAISLAPVDFDFLQMLEDIRLMFARRPEARALTLEVCHAPDVPQFLRSDQGKLRQILVNLVGNAFKFTHQGGVRINASVLSKTSDAFRLVLDIEDTGCGIEIHELESIFEAFEQSASGRKHGKGTGLGLHLSRRYAQALGGDITVTSQPGHGSHFRVTFQAVASCSSCVAKAQSGRVLRLLPGQPRCQVLVVDDDSANRDMLTMLLTAVGFNVEIAESAQVAIERLSQGKLINLVLMDKRMPEMDGYEAIRRIRKLPTGKALAVIVVTASGFTEERELALAAGANGYVAKPVRRSELLDEIGRVTDVVYEYEETPESDLAATPLALSTTALTAMPPELRDRLESALSLGDIQEMRAIIAVISDIHPALAASVRPLVEAYDYESLHALLAAAKQALPAPPP